MAAASGRPTVLLTGDLALLHDLGGLLLAKRHGLNLTLVAINNEFYTDLPLSLSMGLATGYSGERLEAVVKRADMEMLEAKRRFYAEGANDRRRIIAAT